MKKWTSYKSELADENFDAIIIGSGIGGLSTAALLALNGKRVLVLENISKSAAGLIHFVAMTLNGMWVYTT